MDRNDEIGGDLGTRLRRAIAERGPITFAEFMDLALYDPEEGFYARLPVGERGDFVTSPHVSPVFGLLMTRQVEDFWHRLDRPDPFDVVEIGAADGTLARQIIEAAPAPLAAVMRYTAVERGAAGRAALRKLPVRVHQAMGDLDPLPAACLIANEVLDNLPFHRVRQTDRGLAELFVTVEDSRFMLVEGPPSRPEVGRLAPALDTGQEAAVSVASLEFLDQAVSRLGRGYILLIDYASEPDGSFKSVHGYRAHRVEEDVLAGPGTRDITSGVDFGLLVRHARSRNLEVWGPVSQRRALLGLGFRALDQTAHQRQVQAVSSRRGIEALRIYSNRTRANLLLGTGLGTFTWLCLGVGVEAPPAWIREG
jgi:SAM-dependent MidA family methyltransferase